ncbi:MAG: hypothetical protein NC251_01065 [Lachnoclostridium sp.]|nr:hypothetical protein [Lachnospira sp.]MCM1247005.1 hypothetical protein [Lachnoclostridium sp.]
MSRVEQKILDFIIKHSTLFFLAIITLLAALVRFQARGFLSADMEFYLLPWYHEIKEGGGLTMLKQQVGNYNITYQFCIALMTYVENVNPIFLYKGLSMLFDFLLAAVTGLTVYELSEKKNPALSAIAYGAVLFFPTVLLNSSFWGQCDAIYTFFVILSLYLLLRNKTKTAFAMLGVAVAFKLQAMFILPFLLIYYVLEKRYSILHYLISLAAFYIMSLPGVLGRHSLLAPFRIYANQKGSWTELYKNFPSFLVFFGNEWETYEAVSRVIFLMIIALFGIALLYFMQKKIPLYRTKYFILMAAWSVWTCVLFLPEMHERYGYLLDILLLLVLFFEHRYAAAILPAFVSGIITYSCYLFHRDYNLVALSVLYTAAYFTYTYLFIRQMNKDTVRLDEAAPACK